MMKNRPSESQKGLSKRAAIAAVLALATTYGASDTKNVQLAQVESRADIRKIVCRPVAPMAMEEGEDVNNEYDFEKAQNESFGLDQQLLEEYPEMKSLSRIPTKRAPRVVWNISQIYVNGRTIDAFIQAVIDREPNGDIELLLEMVEDGLKELKVQGHPPFRNFLVKEFAKFEDRKKRAKQAIGNKKRNMRNMGTYE